MEQEITFGFPDQWKAFQGRHEKFLSRFPNLRAAIDIAFLRTFGSSGPEERVIFIMGRVCSEEFFEILLLAGNGYGFGALKLLRGLYERAVTMAFLSDNPNDVDAFMNYHVVAQRKLRMALKETFGHDVLDEASAEKAESEYKSVKDAYMITDCAKCGTSRINHTWHKLDIVSMAKKTALGKLIVPAYYIPMSHGHSTVRALLSRVEHTDSGGMGFNPDLQPKEADMALELAHNIMIAVLDVQRQYFKLTELDQPLQTCVEDFQYVWRKGDSTPTDPSPIVVS
jgi:Family of unknown function (DUF5677)